MRKFILEPLVGAGDLKFGQTRDQVRQLMGTPSVEHAMNDYYFDAALRIDYNDDLQVEFMEFTNDEALEVEISGENPFKLLANDLVKLLLALNGDDGVVNKREAPFSYAFYNISTGIYRDATEEDINISIDEAKRDGTYEEDKEWLAEELEKYSHFQAIGIGRNGYYVTD